MATSAPAFNNLLKDRKNFPPFTCVPTEDDIDEDYYSTDDGYHYHKIRHWCFLGEITDDTTSQFPFCRNRILVKDLDGVDNIPIAFYPDPDSARMYFDFTELKRGHTICIQYAEKHYFLDMTVGFRIENLDFVKVIKCPLETLSKISLLDPTNRPKLCWTCGAKETKSGMKLLSCQRCKYAKYCGRDCQKENWKRHKKCCPYIQDYATLVSLANREFKNYIPFSDI